MIAYCAWQTSTLSSRESDNLKQTLNKSNNHMVEVYTSENTIHSMYETVYTKICRHFQVHEQQNKNPVSYMENNKLVGKINIIGTDG